jgi:hypothetical protein
VEQITRLSGTGMARGCMGGAITSPKQNLKVSLHRGFESDFEIKRIKIQANVWPSMPSELIEISVRSSC